METKPKTAASINSGQVINGIYYPATNPTCFGFKGRRLNSNFNLHIYIITLGTILLLSCTFNLLSKY